MTTETDGAVTPEEITVELAPETLVALLHEQRAIIDAERERAERAEADVAALREALELVVDSHRYRSWTDQQLRLCVNCGSEAMALVTARDALAQPHPGEGRVLVDAARLADIGRLLSIWSTHAAVLRQYIPGAALDALERETRDALAALERTP